MQALIVTVGQLNPRWATLDAKREAIYHARLTGWTDVGEDVELQEFLTPARIKTLSVIGQFKSSPLRAIPASYVLYELPDGDRLQKAHDAEFHRWTKRADVIARARIRRRIRAHIYAPVLASALADLERARVGGGQFSWLGGTWGLASFAETGRRDREPGHRVLTAEEQINQLRSLLIARCDLPCMSATDQQMIGKVFDLLDHTSIRDELNEDARLASTP